MLRKIVVCDDESAVHRQLMGYIRQLETETGDEYETVHFSSGEELLEHIPSDAQLLLLDIQMDGLSGIDAARKLRERNRDLLIILVTNLIDHALQGYEIHAFSFICKPVMYGDFRRSLLDAFYIFDKSRPASLAVPDVNSTELIALNELIYAEVYHHETSIVTVSGRREYRIQLGEIEQKTSGRGFFRCHKSYLVNLAHIKRIDRNSLTMSNGDEVPLSKYRRAEFLEAYSFYAGERL